MALLFFVSLLWAFSFGLIKGLGDLDPSAVAAVRMALSAALFLPFARARGLPRGLVTRLVLIGALQLGAMYLFYLRSFAHLKAYEVALFTVTTPVWVAAVDATLERRLNLSFFAAALLALGGAAAELWADVDRTGVLQGFVYAQLSNLCFAVGQVAWRRERLRPGLAAADATLFAFALLGALLLTAGAATASGSWGRFHPTGQQWVKLLYLGLVPSGIGFFLWNRGAARVNAGVLAAMNNAKIPLGIVCSLVVFGEKADLPRLLAGAVLLAAGVVVAARAPSVKR